MNILFFWFLTNCRYKTFLRRTLVLQQKINRLFDYKSLFEGLRFDEQFILVPIVLFVSAFSLKFPFGTVQKLK